MKEKASLKRYTLKSDFGNDVSFTGSLKAESMNYNEESAELVSEKIFKTEQGRTGYSVAVRKESSREKRAYLVDEQSEVCMISNGNITLEIDTENLLTLLTEALKEQVQESSQDQIDYMRKYLQAVND